MLVARLDIKAGHVVSSLCRKITTSSPNPITALACVDNLKSLLLWHSAKFSEMSVAPSVEGGVFAWERPGLVCLVIALQCTTTFFAEGISDWVSRGADQAFIDQPA